MWDYEKRLQYPVNIKKPNAKLAQYIISQYGGPDGELGASMRYLSQRYASPYREVSALLTDIGNEGLLLHTPPRIPIKQGFSKIYRRENAKVPIPGYLYSIEMEPVLYRYSAERQQAIYRKADKPRWQIDVCVAIPDHRTFGNGGAK